MMRTPTIALSLLAAVLVAGCGGRVPDRLPPPPGQWRAGPAEAPFGAASGASLQADFLRSVPSDRIFFEGAGYALDDQDRAVLDAQAAWILRTPQARIIVEGHSDDGSTRDYSLALGDRRASAAAIHLQARGIAAERMSVVSWGKERPPSGSPGGPAPNGNRVVVLVAEPGAN